MIFLGIDGGATKTFCLAGDEKSVLGSGASGSSNLIRVGEAQARESLNSAIQQACAAAHVSPAQIHKTCVGLAGAGRSEISSAARRAMLEIVGGEVQIVGDTIIALEAAFGRGPGVVVIAGTGSIAYGRNAAGQTARAGGWGFAISDGVFQNAALVREHFYKTLRSEYPNASINETVVEPVRGALELARRGTAP